MRTLTNILCAGLLLIACSRCSKSFVDLENPNAASIDEGYQTETDIAAGVNGVYQSLRSSNAVGEGASLWTDDRSDDVNSTDNQSNNGEPFQFTAFALVPSNTYLFSHWQALYAPIVRANTILGVIGNITFTSADTKAQYIAEMKFIRAFMYFQLVREFGDVPVVTERLTNPGQVEERTFREKREVVYEQIIKDLKEVLSSPLPVSWPASGKGRASLQAANGLLGQVYLTMATTLDAAKRTENLNNAKTYLTACYNQKTFATLSAIPFADVFSVDKKNNAEIIWQIVYKQGDATYSSSLARNNQAQGETINSLFVSQSQGALFTNDLLKEFEAGDVRTTYSVKLAASTNRYFITKFRDASAGATNLGYGGNDWILMRYADIILNLAEVHLYLNETPQAITYLDMVRARAQRPLYADMMQDAAYAARYPTLKLAILHERRVELAFEHHRWHDLTRFFTPEELVAYFKTKSQADYDNSPLSNIGTKDYYFPIPEREVNLNREKMYQNPGY